MNFSANVKEITEENLVLSFPTKIYKNLSRKYERVPPPAGSKIVFTVKGEKFQLDFPKTDEIQCCRLS
jgi:hypothetical protein